MLCFAAAAPWAKKNPDQWTAEDVQRILSNSPWAQPASAGFPDPRKNEAPESVYNLPGPEQAGMAGPRGATDGRWDGGVSKNTHIGVLPTLPVIVRWDSALPVRQALQKSKAGSAEALGESKNYVVTVEGLVPAGRYHSAGQIETKSSSDETTGSAANPEPVLESLMAHSRLLVRGHAPIACVNAALDAGTGALHLAFPRTGEIKRSDKEVILITRFGSFTVEKRFRLSDMVYEGKLEL
jgi:hypothetical protein